MKHKPKRIKNKTEPSPIFVDTSALIDGRILSVAKAGFLSGNINIPRTVIGELQYLADTSDSEKRARARHGLDIVSELQAVPGLDIKIFQDGSSASEGVDERLLNLAKKHNGSILTIDYNLNKVAKVEGIEVLNVNDLAMSLRMLYLPSERLLLELNQKGQDAHQAVGHLTDGTMVVVENASSKIGQIVEVEFIRSLQTAAGKMMFARLIEKNIQPNSRNTQNKLLKENTNQPKKSFNGRQNSKPNSNSNPNTNSNQNTSLNKKPVRNFTNKKHISKGERNEQDFFNLANNR